MLVLGSLAKPEILFFIDCIVCRRLRLLSGLVSLAAWHSQAASQLDLTGCPGTASYLTHPLRSRPLSSKGLDLDLVVNDYLSL